MTYNIGELIAHGGTAASSSADEFNRFYRYARAIFGVGGFDPATGAVDGTYGYGQFDTGEGVAVGPSVPLPPDPATGINLNLRQLMEIIPTSGVNPGQIIGRFLETNPFVPTSPYREWEAIRQAYHRSALHQGLSIPSFIASSATFARDEIVYAETGGSNDPNHPSGSDQDFPSLISNVVSNRDNYDLSEMATTTIVNTSNAVFFNNSLEWTVVISATTQDHLRFFFNSGGALTIIPTFLSSGNPQSNDWQVVISGLTATVDYNIFWNTLSSSYTTLDSGTGSGAYSTNVGTIQARINGIPDGVRGNKGLSIEFRIFLNDQHSNPFQDYASGTFGVSISHRVSDGIVEIPSLTSGSPSLSTS